ncbi:hypothetical protein VTJ04DRAFT_10777 [Mycothermus thermophilus]|uniref:uncharacterized protein n=1 Tax=Humicola insolens TaxID=85995 RepID=UPI0037446F5A
MPPIRRITRILLPAILLTLTLYNLSGPHTLNPLPASWTTATASFLFDRHPIDQLIREADAEFAAKLAKQTTTLAKAAAAYRKRRGRHPPPGFDKWYAFAVERDVIMVEDFWDPIYHDLEPFWGVEPALIRRRVRDVDMRIEIKGGKASTGSDWFWTQIWLEMIRKVEHMLPDMEIALNAMDEPRVVVPWEEVEKLMKQAGKRRKMVDVKQVVEEFGAWQGEEKEIAAEKTVWEGEKHYWLIARRGCEPESIARRGLVVTNFNKTPTIFSSYDLGHTRNGYVSNFTLSTNFCFQPDLQALEGIFVEPLSVSATAQLVPIFGGSKLSVNNDILLPAPMYWNEEARFTGAEGADIPWASKVRSPAVIWRGVATGGRNRESNWRSFQRHRFVAMNNATQLALAESGEQSPMNFVLPDPQYRLAALAKPEEQRTTTTTTTTTTQQPGGGGLSRWLSSTVDVAFTDLMCAYPDFGVNCNYTGDYFSPATPVPMADQFRHPILPDIDGNSFSGRYLGFLRSTSMPVKATLWREWHDGRLQAWKHFVPMDNRFGDWYGILEYFAGNEELGVQGRWEQAEKIAMEGREWAAKVLRREDMLVYLLRVLLEYARVADERREVLGWVGDLR